MKTFYPQKPLLITLEQPLFKELELREDVVAEPKYNGTRLILQRFKKDFLEGGGYYQFWNRSGELLKYDPSKELVDQLDQIKWEGDCALDGELMHFKTIKVKHTVVLFDVLVWNGEDTTGKPFSERRALLEKVMDEHNPPCVPYHNGGLWLAPQWKGGRAGTFLAVYTALTKLDEIEGIVIKSLSKPHKLGRTGSITVKTMWKVRKPGPTYRF